MFLKTESTEENVVRVRDQSLQTHAGSREILDRFEYLLSLSRFVTVFEVCFENNI